MLKRLYAGALAAAALVAGPSAAAEKDRMFQAAAPDACVAALAETGKPVALTEPLDEATRRGMLSAIFLALQDPAGAQDWPAREIAAARPCPVARFAADERVWTISSGSGRAPVRWIATADRPDLFFLVQGPSLADAGKWAETRRGLPAVSGAGFYYLVGRAEELNFLIKLYDGPPSARRLADDIGAMLDGDAAPLAAHDPVGDVVSLFQVTASGAPAEVFRPDEIGKGGVGALFMPDGHLVQRGEDDAYVFRGSGFACREDYGELRRHQVGIGNLAEEALELSCQLRHDDATMTVIVNRNPDVSLDKAIFSDVIGGLEKSYGVAKRFTSPPTGRDSPIRAGKLWLDEDGFVQLVAFIRRGDYVYELRETYTPEAAELAMKALEQVIDQISGPDPQSAAGWRRQR